MMKHQIECITASAFLTLSHALPHTCLGKQDRTSLRAGLGPLLWVKCLAQLEPWLITG